MINTKLLFHARFIFTKTVNFWMKLNVTFDTHSLLRAEIVLNVIKKPPYIVPRFLGNFEHINQF